MLKKLCLLTVLFLGINTAQAQMFAPKQNTQNTSNSKTVQTKANTQAKPDSKPLLDENGAPNYVVRNFVDSEKTEKEYDNSSRKVFSLKMVNGEIVADNPPRSILISYEDYKINKSFDNWIRCSLRIYVLNDLTKKINNFSFKLHWPEMDTAIQMNRLNPGVRTYKDVVLLGEGCFNLDKAPTIEVNRCRVKGMTQEQCADAVKWFQSKK